MDYSLRPVSFADLPGWDEDDPSDAVSALGRCFDHLKTSKPYKTGSLGLSAGDLIPAMQAASHVKPGAETARQFFENWFLPFAISPSSGHQGFVTAYYEPEIEVRAEANETYLYPFYRRPPDLLDLDHSNRPSALDPSYMFGRLDKGQLVAYPDRRAIDEGYLEGQGLEIAWAKSKVDVFFVHVQGAARLKYPDGSVARITYSAKAGHPFTAIGRYLLDHQELDPVTVSMQTIRAWLTANPERVDEVLWQNRSYIFFRQTDVGDPDLGPVAAAKVQIAAGRSIAVDRSIHTFGTPFFISSQSLTHLDQGKPFQRLMIGLDTGTAIVGPARADIFTGSGDAAGELAGSVRNPADFFILIPRSAAHRYLP
jgi:membrane-bound lytic murein transglycosylase A